MSGENNPDGDVTEVGENGDVDVKEDDDEDVSGEGRVPRSCLVGGNQTVIVCAPTICQNIKLQQVSPFKEFFCTFKEYYVPSFFKDAHCASIS